MNACLQQRGIKDSKDRKPDTLLKAPDMTERSFAAAVVALHKTSSNPDMWLQRPLPEMLLRYAAHDLELIAQLYVNFQRAGWINKRNVPQLKAQSERYLRTFRTRAIKDLFDQRGLGPFMPLHVLETPP